MKEIGGYLDFELRFDGNEYHKNAIALNLARNALIYLARIKNYQKIYIPYFLCDCIRTTLKENGINFSYYQIDNCCRPIFEDQLADHEAILIVNYYGQLSKEEIDLYNRKWHGRIIIDNTHDFFGDRVSEVDMIYSPRKYFGIADGAYLYTDTTLPDELPQGYSYDRIRHLIGRYEKTANEFYEDYVNAEKLLSKEPLKKMSAFSQNILKGGVDYDRVRKCREENFLYLHQKLGRINQWRLRDEPGTYMYPLWIENGLWLRKELQKDKIYIPVLWPNVLEDRNPDDLEYQMAINILPLPIDQRYTLEDMEYLCKKIFLMKNSAQKEI